MKICWKINLFLVVVIFFFCAETHTRQNWQCVYNQKDVSLSDGVHQFDTEILARFHATVKIAREICVRALWCGASSSFIAVVRTPLLFLFFSSAAVLWFFSRSHHQHENENGKTHWVVKVTHSKEKAAACWNFIYSLTGFLIANIRIFLWLNTTLHHHHLSILHHHHQHHHHLHRCRADVWKTKGNICARLVALKGLVSFSVDFGWGFSCFFSFLSRLWINERRINFIFHIFHNFCRKKQKKSHITSKQTRSIRNQCEWEKKIVAKIFAKRQQFLKLWKLLEIVLNNLFKERPKKKTFVSTITGIWLTFSQLVL